MNAETDRPARPAGKDGVTDAATRVLLVEDSPSDADLLQQSLRQIGAGAFEFTWVDCLGDALWRLGRESFDVLLLDLSLPDSSGPETFRRVLEAAPQLAIVVLTGASDESIGLAAVHEGVQDYLVKGQAGLHSQYLQGLSWKTREPLDREERHDRHLANHEQLKDVCGCPLIGLADDAEHDNVTKNHGKGDERHCSRKEGARLPDHF